jgi:recombinational DNA repair protein (RecF pathway)
LATQCEMIVGFLVPHRCPNAAMAACTKCGRQFCEEHVTFAGGGLVCIACQQGLDQPVAIPETAREFDEADLLAFEAVDIMAEDDDLFSDLS